MIYEASELIQLLVLVVCFMLALVRAVQLRSAAQIELVCFFACMLLGNVYYYGFLIVFDGYPRFSYIADLGWIAGYIFLLMLMIECEQRRGLAAPVPAAWIPVAACAACCIFYICVNGYPLLNIADNGLMAALGFFAVRGLAAHPDGDCADGFADNRRLHAAVLAFVAVEQMLWLSSLLPDVGSDISFYTVFNYALTLAYAAILVCAERRGRA